MAQAVSAAESALKNQRIGGLQIRVAGGLLVFRGASVREMAATGVA